MNQEDQRNGPNKRNSGLFSFFRWFRPSTSRESVTTHSPSSSSSSSTSSCDSLDSIASSTGTIASFNYIPPDDYKPTEEAKQKRKLQVGPETDTYKARVKQRECRRERDKDLTLRKKYNLFFNTKSLPVMTRKGMEKSKDEGEEKKHRRSNSDCSKVKKAGAYCHVKGKRRAPPPPIQARKQAHDSTLSLRRKKRVAPPPPEATETVNQIVAPRVVDEPAQAKVLDALEYADADVIYNDCLKLDHGILKSALKQPDLTNNLTVDTSTKSSKSSGEDGPVSPRPWYKRPLSRDSSRSSMKEAENKYEPIEMFPEVQYSRGVSSKYEDVELGKKKQEDATASAEKRKSGIAFLTNISELDREAYEIVRKEHQNDPPPSPLEETPPLFMRPKQEHDDTWSVSPKRRSARDLIAKFNAITNVTKVTVNSAFFGPKDQQQKQRSYFGRQHSEPAPLAKSESAVTVAPKQEKHETPKLDRKSWSCPKCSLENDYWRIICYVCSTIKPYFDDLTTPPTKNNPEESRNSVANPLPPLERSKTQIGFSALASLNKRPTPESKTEEKERLKKILIEMKNSLPKRRLSAPDKATKRVSMIPEAEPEKPTEKTREILVTTRETVYENILIKNPSSTKPLKVSSSAQTSGVPRKINLISSANETLVNQKPSNYELMRPKDFDNVYSVGTVPDLHIYANLLESKDIFIGMPERFSELKNNTDTLEVSRLLKRLETAIANGELSGAANLARELAQMKVNCSVVRQKASEKDSKSVFTIKMYLEDKTSHRGPFAITVTKQQTVGQLKRQVEKDFELPSAVQRWILGKELATDDEATLEDLHITTEGCPVFLYLVAPTQELKVSPQSAFRPFTKAKRDEEVVSISKSSKEHFNQRLEGKDEASEPKGILKPSVRIQPAKVAISFNPLQKSVNLEPQTLRLGDQVLKTASPKAEQTKAPENQSTTSKVQEIQRPENNQEPKPESSNSRQNQRLENAKPNTATPISSQIQKAEKQDLNPQRLENLTPQTSSTALQEVPPKAASSNLKQVQRPKNEGPKIIPQKAQPTVLAQSSLQQIQIPPDCGTKPQLTTSKVEQVQAPEKVSPSSVLQIQHPPTIHHLGVAAPKPFTRSCIENVSILQSKLQFNHQPSPPKTAPEKAAQPETKPETKQVKQKEPKIEEEEEDYDVRTLRPQPKEWECIMCTLLNPQTSKICAVCATVRQFPPVKAPRRTKSKAPQPHYLQLVDLDSTDLVSNTEPFECLICFLEIQPGEGGTLRECLHQFCKACLSNTVEFSEEAEVKCPYRDSEYSCDIALQDREVKALVSPEVYDKFLAKSVAQAENKIDKSFHCKTPDCKGWCIFEDNVNHFRCPVCKNTNCLTCQAIHMGANCKEYQERMKLESATDEDAKRTREMLEEMVSNGEAIRCPTCHVILMKKWGCDWLRCSMCKTEICWVTRGPRWGPAGKGDSSGGCQCGVKGVKCHPQCNYCH